MRRSLPWLILSLLCFGLAVYFWRLGDRWAAEKKPPVPQVLSSNSALRTPHSALPSTPDTGHSLSVSAPAALARLTNNSPLPFRLSNTTNRVGALERNDHAILLENALLDTDQKVDLAIPPHLKSQGNPGAWIVQARKPIDDAFRALLQNAGATIISYIPNNAYLVRVSDGSSFNLQPGGLVQAVLPYEPYYKLKPALLAPAIKQQLLPEGTVVNLLVYNDALTQTEDALKAMGAEVLGSPERSPFGRVIHVAPPRNATPAIAQLPGVQEMELARPRLTANDLSRVTLGISPDSVTSTNYLDLSGSNITVGVVDTGVDTNHPDLLGRVFFDLPISGVDSNGHGTFIAGIISGNGSQSTTVSNAQGSVMPATNGQFRGKAPASTNYSISLANGSDTYLQEQLAGQSNVLIANNSWTYGSQSYDLAAANYDAAVRDALPAVPGSRQLLYVFPSGNGGGANVWDTGLNDNGVGGSADSIQSPGTAKNVITVGAIEQMRNITNQSFQCVTQDTNTVCTTNQPWLPSTDASDQVAAFSGRGNVGVEVEGESGRFKPDVVAPGTMIISTRSTEWDTNAYYSPTTHIIKAFSGIVLHTNAAFFNQIFVPQNTVGLTIEVFANNDSPVPFPDMPIFVRQAGLPILTNGPSGYDFVRTNVVTMPPDGGTPISPVGELWRYAVANVSAQTVVFDLVTDLTVTNQHGNFLDELKTNLNDVIGPFYRYESGTSLAAGQASGVLALMEEFLEQRSGGLFGPTNQPSPALMKALLINGSRSVGDLYDFTVDTTINFQGWGLVNLPNSVPAPLTNFSSTGSSSLLLFDQDPTNALATGQTHTRLFTLNPDAQNLNMHITLVWTDPPGNPVAGKKLVNDLDLIVTNLDTGEVFFGNDILAGNDFNLPSDTNLPPNLDVVNNVENVYLLGPLGTNYSVTVLGHRVNVNAVTAHTNQVVQDYALVIGSDASFTNGLALTNSVTLTNGTTITADVFPANPPTTPLLTTITNQFVGNTNFTGGILLNQRAGASTPLLGLNTVSATNNDTPTMGLTAGLATVGMTNQWHFYTLTNENSFTNASFLTFLPPTLSIPRIGTRASSNENSTRLEADIDMYVSTDPSLTNLNPVALNGAFKSLTREGEETVVLTNAIPGAYYIGVKSEDQEASEYDFMGIFSLLPPDTVDDEGNHHLHGFPVPQAIPDGTPAHPGGIRVLAVATSGVKVKRVVVTNTVSHQLMGDLIGTLTHKRTFAVLNNHAPDGAVTNRVYVYDDSGQGTPAGTPSAQRTDGPGSLMNFGGQTGTGQWMVTMADNALGHVGTNNDLQIFLERQQDPTDGVVTNFIQPNSCVQDFVDVPVGATNMLVLVTNFNGVGPIVVTVCAPDGGACMVTNIPALPLASIALNFDRTTIPLISPGTWTIKQCNLSQSQVAETHLFVKIGIDLNSVVPVQYQSTGPVAIADDAVTTSSLVVTNANKLFSVEVGLRVDHPRVSDLVFHLISPKGVRNLLFENRGGLAPNGMGLSVITTNIVPTSSDGGAQPQTNSVDTGISNWTATITYNMQTIPDEMAVYSGTNLLVDTGFVSGAGTLNVSNPPGGSTVITIVMNPNGNPQPGTVWDYTLTSVRADYLYYNFTEDTNKTLTPIKFAVPPYIPTTIASTNGSNSTVILTTNVTSSIVISTNPVITNIPPVLNDGFEYTFNGAPGPIFSGWHLDSGSINVLPAGIFGGFVPDSGTNAIDINGDNPNPIGTLSTNVTLRPGHLYRLSFAYAANPDGRPTVPTAQISVLGITNVNVSPVPTISWSSVGWQTTSVVFTATASAATVQAKGINNSAYGVLLDSFKLQEIRPVDDGFEYASTGGGYPAGGKVSGWFIESGTVDVVSPGFGMNVPPDSGTNALDLNGNKPGAISTNFPTTVGSNYFVTFAFTKNPSPANPPGFVATGDVTLNGGLLGQLTAGWPNTFNSLNWAHTSYVFTASSPVTKLQFTSTDSTPQNAGLYLDTVRVALLDAALFSTNTIFATNITTNVLVITNLAFATNNFVLPEESIDNLRGSNAKGTWQLEVWDNRVGPSGASNGPASLVSWQLSFIFENQVPAPVNLLPGEPVTGTVCPGQMQVFTVDVPYWTDFASNRLISATGAGVNVWFNQTQPPTGTNPPDSLLIGPNSTGGTFVITNTSAPPLVPSATYFIGIQSTNGCSTYTFDVEFDVTPISLNVPFTVTNSPARAITRAVTATNTGPIPKYFSYVVNSNETAVSFQVTNIQGGNVDLVVSRAPKFPDLTNYDYGSFNLGTQDEDVLVFTNSEPVVLAPGTWYLGVFNRSAGTVSYTVAVTDFTNALPNIIPLFLDVPYKNTNIAAANTTNYYRYTVTTNETGVQFQLLNLSGDVNLIARKGFPPLPTLANSPYNSQNPGTNNESIIVFTNSTPVALSAGDWFLAVLNPSGTDVSYTALVTDNTGAVPNIITLTNSIPYFNTNNAGANNIDYYLFVVSTNAARAQFEINNPTADMALAVEKDLPLPTLTSWHYFSNNLGTNDELVTVFGSSSPVPLGPGSWFLAAINISGVPAQYSIKATEFPVAGTNIVISNPRLNVTSNEFCFSWNSMVGVHYYVQARPILPGANWDTLATMVATSTNTPFCWPLPSQYHFFRVTEGIATNNFVEQVQIKSINRSPSGVLLTWNAVFNTSYQVLWTPSLAPPNWVSFTNIITSTNGTCTFLDNGSQSGGLGPLRYYRLRNYP